MSEHCPTCGATVEVHHGLEGTSHYRPVKDKQCEAAEAERDRLQHDYDEMAEALQRESDDNFGQFQVAEARARKATEALEKIAGWQAGYMLADDGMAVSFAEDTARSALATIRELPDRPPPPPPPTPGLGRPETQGGRPNREEHG